MKLATRFLGIVSLVLMTCSWPTDSKALSSLNSPSLPSRIYGTFFPLTPLNKDAYFDKQISLAAKNGLNTIALVVHWKDLEPHRDQYTFAPLELLIKAIHDQGMYCIVRIYFNGGPKRDHNRLHESPPSWWFENLTEGEDYYTAPIVDDNWSYRQPRQPLPWRSAYTDQVGELLGKFAVFFKGDVAKPNAIQISVGGDYGEQYLNLPEAMMNAYSYSEYINLLLGAAKHHVNLYTEHLGDYPLIVMAATLIAGDDRDRALLDHALSKGVDYIQTNAHTAKLMECTWGSKTLELFSPYISPYVCKGMKILIEEEAGADTWEATYDKTGKEICPLLPAEPVAARLQSIIELEDKHVITVSGVFLKGYDDKRGVDLYRDGRINSGITALIEHLNNSMDKQCVTSSWLGLLLGE